MRTIRHKRAQEEAQPQDGRRGRVDRAWPRGILKGEASLAEWLKEIAPSDEMRRWFGHDPERGDEFRERYFDELDTKADLVVQLREWADGHALTRV